MKLLSKLEIDQAKSRDRLREIEECKKLAKRVDSLREVQAMEEASLTKFRNETIAQIHEQTRQASEERDCLLQEVSTLQEARKEALRPIFDEQEALRKEKAEQEEARNSIYNERNEVAFLRKTAEADAKDAKDEIQRAEDNSRHVASLISTATLKDEEASRLFEEASSVFNKSVEIKKVMDQTLESQRVQSEANEKRQAIRDKTQDERERALNARETQLADREAMLARNITRFKK